MKRSKWKKMALSRDCSCVKGKNRDSNFDEVIDKLCDKFESKEKKLKEKIRYLEGLLSENTDIRFT